MATDLNQRDRRALDAAIEQAEKSRREGGVPIGAALMSADLRAQTGDPTAHAETVCIRNAGRRRDWHTLTLATTLSPCAMCSGTAVLHRIPRIIIGERDTFLGREDWLEAEGVDLVHADDDRCRALMREFVAARPEVWDEDIGEPG